MKKLKYVLLFLLACAIVFSIIAIVWSSIPLRSEQGNADPTVIFENQRAGQGQQFSESYFEHKGLNLHYVEIGRQDGETILFVHGFPSYWYSFIRQIEHLRKDYRIIAIDGLGAGRSDAPKDVTAYTLENMTAHVKALLAHLNVEKVHLVGHDWGAAFVFGYAQKYPQHAKSVTGISAPPQNLMLKLLTSNAEQQKSSSYVEKLKAANPVLIKVLNASDRIMQGAYLPLVESGKLRSEEASLFQQATNNPKRINAHINWYRANVPSFDEIQDEDFWPSRQARLEVPALIVWGNDDRVFAPEFIDRLDESSNELQVLKFDGVGHWPHVEQSQKVNEAIRALISANE